MDKDDELDLTWLYNRISKLYLRAKKSNSPKVISINAFLYYLNEAAVRQKNKEFFDEKKVLEYPLEKL